METRIREKYAVQDLMLNLGQQELEEAVEELDSAIESQEQWYADLNRVLICRLPANARDLSSEAHHLCAFGAWLDVYANEQIRQQPLFERINHDHKLMHYLASKLLSKIVHDEWVTTTEYEALYKIEKRLRHHLHTLNNELKNKASNLDALTGLYNRKEMHDQLERQHEFVNRGVYDVSIALMDIDYFKAINDTFGHLVGDKLLKALAGYLSESVRAYDTVFRYGGDEFLILLPDAHPYEAQKILSRLHKGIGVFEVEDRNGNAVSATTSFGISALRSGIDIESSIQIADQALYQAKQDGRNRLKIGAIH